MEYYSAIKTNETWPFAMAWMGLEGLLLSEVSQTGKDKCHMISVLCEILKIKEQMKQKQNHRHRKHTDGC